MATLKDHMLVEIATTLCERARPDVRMVFIDALPSIEAFIFSGKGPFYAFRRVFMDNVIITFVSSNMVRMVRYFVESLLLTDRKLS
uniref:CRAL-TRIO domain-containing protein n=1 Tax=Panagrellus redivivus TaxID=6233 RepID=A0A7E4VY15_PANRE